MGKQILMVMELEESYVRLTKSLIHFFKFNRFFLDVYVRLAVPDFPVDGHMHTHKLYIYKTVSYGLTLLQFW